MGKRQTPWITASNPPLPAHASGPSHTKFIAYTFPGDKKIKIGMGFASWSENRKTFIWFPIGIIVHWWLDIKIPGKNYALLKKLKKVSNK